MYPENKAIQEILEIREQFNSRKVSSWTGEELSRIAVRLSTLNSYLGELCAEATYIYNKAYIFRKFKYLSEFKRLRIETDKKIGEAENEALTTTKEDMENEAERQYQADLLKSLHDDIDNLIRQLQSRASELRVERVNSTSSN